MSDRQLNIALALGMLALLIAATITGAELQGLRLENEHLKAECAMKDDALGYANRLIEEMEDR